PPPALPSFPTRRSSDLFLPSPGKLIALQFPHHEDLRVDAGVEAGDQVTPYYDPMIAKLIAHDKSRQQALDRLADALDSTIVAGRSEEHTSELQSRENLV